MNEIFYELIRVALGTQDNLTRLPSEAEWDFLFDMAKKQSVLGITFVALQKLGANADPSLRQAQGKLGSGQVQDEPYATIGMSEDTYFTWAGVAAKINVQNEIVNQQCAVVQRKLSADGFKCCILKGQGVAQQYDEPLRGFRQSGDIDVWVHAPLKQIMEYVNRICPSNRVDGHHVHFPVFSDTEVELHYVAANLPNPFKNRKLQKFFEQERENCRCVKLGDGEVMVPSLEFNLVHLMVHTYHHFFTEGVGMRQLMDYYFVLRAKGFKVPGSKVQEVSSTIESLGLKRFAQGVMWIMESVFGLDKECLLFEADPEAGVMLLSEVMARGNFGKMDENSVLEKDLMGRSWQKLAFAWKNRRLAPDFWFWNPIHSTKLALWKRMNGYK